jgi:hypothetical protein
MRVRPIILAAPLLACTAGTALNGYPRTQIDRPYTLPAGVDAWSVGTGFAVARDDTESKLLILLLGPEWDLSLSDDWGLILGPSLGVSHQLLRDDRQKLAATLVMSAGVGSDGFLFAPSLRIDHQLRLSRRWAWSTALTGSASRWTDRPGWAWGGGVGTGPLWQATETLALQLSLALSFFRNQLGLLGLSSVRADRWAVSPALGASWSLGRQWELGASVGYERIGYSNGYREFWVTGSVVNFW